MEKFMRNLLIGMCAAGIVIGCANLAKANDFVVTTERTYSGGWRTVYSELRPIPRADVLDQPPAPPNDCDRAGVGGFQVVNPGKGERACVGRR